MQLFGDPGESLKVWAPVSTLSTTRFAVAIGPKQNKKPKPSKVVFPHKQKKWTVTYLIVFRGSKALLQSLGQKEIRFTEFH